MTCRPTPRARPAGGSFPAAEQAVVSYFEQLHQSRQHPLGAHLPAVVFDPRADGRPTDADTMLRRLMELLEVTYDRLLRGGGES